MIRGLLMVVLIASSECYAGLVWSSQTIKTKASVGASVVRIQFECTNLGKTAVAIARVQKSCRCADVKLSPKSIATGHKGTLTLDYYVGKKVGTQKGSIRLYTTDGEIHKLVTVVHVPAPVTVSPEKLEWQVGAASSPKSVVVRGHKDLGDFRVENVLVRGAKSVFDVVVKSGADGSHGLTIKVQKTAAPVAASVWFDIVAKKGGVSRRCCLPVQVISSEQKRRN